MRHRERDDDEGTVHVPASQAGSDASAGTEMPDAPSPDVAASPGMNRDPLAGALDQGSLQTDTIEDATEEDTGLPARNNPAPPGGAGSRNTSAPAGEEVGADEPDER